MNDIKLDFRPLIYKLEIMTNKFVESDYAGNMPSLQKRKGLEFDDFKVFSPGEDASAIDWKASLRSGNLLIREYTQFQTLNIFILLDVSNSMLFSSIPKLKCEYAAELAASLSYFFLKSDDLVSLSMINDSMKQFIPPSFGSRHFSTITKALGNPDFYGGHFNITNALSYLKRFIRGGSTVIIISDFIGMELEYAKTLNALTSRADIFAIIIRDPEDQRINEKIGHTVIEDPFSSDIMHVDMEAAKNQYAAFADEQLKKVRLVLKKGGIESVVLDTSKSFVDPIARFFGRKKSRWQ